MPVVESSSYRAPFGLRNGHLQTVLGSLFRKISLTGLRRERIELHDGDFIDIDWQERGYHRVAIIAHGLEGDSQRPYVLGLIRCLARQGWDTVAWNCRGCSGEPNRLPRSYHSGASEDLDEVVKHVVSRRPKACLGMAGFSLGGNLTLKYLGEDSFPKPPNLRVAAVVSVPCDLQDAAVQLALPENRYYMRRFIRCLSLKIRQKSIAFPDLISTENLDLITTFHEFDDRYTAPLHGFKGVNDYYQSCSSRGFLRTIRVPTLIFNALDDPFLVGGCYPLKETQDHPLVHLETPQHGGHVGFIQFNRNGNFGSDLAVSRFLNEHS